MKPLNITQKNTVLALCLAMSFFPRILWADQAPKQDEQSPAAFASFWDIPKLYENKNNPSLQSFSLVGRYHGQYWWAESEGNRDDGWENRRFYLGFNTKLFKQFTLEVQISINDDFNPVYDGLYDAFLKWENADQNFAISGGRLDYVYTGLERSTSSKKIKTMERSLLVNQTMPGEVIGIYAEGSTNGLSYQTGIFSGSIEDEFTSFEGGFAALLGIAYSVPLFYDKGTLHLDYLYNNGNEDNNAFKPYEHIISLWHQGQKGPWGVDIDLTAANGIGEQSDVFGFTLLPTYDFANDLMLGDDLLQLALRYHHASSQNAHGLSFNKRYEQKVATGRGDFYNSYYLGLNYYMYQQKLKLMAGLEYFDMDGVAEKVGNTSIDGWSLVTGVRVYF